MKDINFTVDSNRFNLRVSCLIMCDDKILISKHEKQDFYNIPGGRMKMGESSVESIQRELKEELDLDNCNLKLVAITENFFNWMGCDVQEQQFVYFCNIPSSHELYKTRQFINKDCEQETFTWIDVKDFKNYNVKPEFLLNIDFSKLDNLQHIILK